MSNLKIPMEDTLPSYVVAKASLQALHMKELLQEAENNEIERERRFKQCPASKRGQLEERFESERTEDAKKISRMREEHAALLAHEMHRRAPEQPRQHGRKGAFRATGPHKQNLKGLLTHDYIAMKEVYQKIESTGGGKQPGGQSRPPPRPSARPESMRNREDLLAQRANIMARLSALESLGAGAPSTRRSAAGSSRHSSSSSSTAPHTARSSASSTASGATFCDPDAQMRWRSSHPRSVPPLRTFKEHG